MATEVAKARSAGLARQRSEDSEDLTSSSSTPSKRQSYVKPSSLKKIFDATSVMSSDSHDEDLQSTEEGNSNAINSNSNNGNDKEQSTGSSNSKGPRSKRLSRNLSHGHAVSTAIYGSDEGRREGLKREFSNDSVERLREKESEKEKETEKEKEREMEKEKMMKKADVSPPAAGNSSPILSRNSPSAEKRRMSLSKTQRATSGINMMAQALLQQQIAQNATPRPSSPLETSSITSTKSAATIAAGNIYSPSAVKNPQLEESNAYGKIFRDGSRRVLMEGSLRYFLEWILHDSPDASTVQHLLLAHGQFIPSTTFFEAMEAAFDKYAPVESEIAHDALQSSDSLSLQMRLLNIIKTWVNVDYRGMREDTKLIERIQRFLDRIKISSPNLFEYINTIIKAHEKKMNETDAESRSPARKSEPSLPNDSTKSFTDFTPLDVAQQICLIDNKMINEIPVNEFLRTKWTTPNAPAIDAVMVYANKLSYYLVYMIIKEPEVKDRLRVWSHVVKIGKHLLDLQNFNSALVVFLALNNRYVLKAFRFFKRDVPKKVAKQYEELLSTMSPKSNFVEYRQLIKNVSGPYIPCYEVHLKDLLYTTEGNADFIDKFGKILNIYKMDLMGKVISVFRNAATSPYQFNTLPELFEIMSIGEYSIQDLERLIANVNDVPVFSSSSEEPPPVDDTTDDTPSPLTDTEKAAMEAFSIDWSALPSDPEAKEEFLRVGIEEFKVHLAKLVQREKELEQRLKKLTRSKSGNSSQQTPDTSD